MKGDPEQRAVQLGEYIAANRATVRAAAAVFGCSKSTVHKDLQDRLPQFKRSLYLQVKEVLDVNKASGTSGAASPPEKNTRVHRRRKSHGCT